jgi:GNAT superfamily N-acetyltransferase
MSAFDERGTLPDGVGCRRVRADDPAATPLLAAYYAELADGLGGFDPGRSVSAEPDEMAPPAGAFFVLELAGRPVGCAGLKTHAPGVGEVKRMFLAADVRGRGLGRVLLRVVEDEARRLGMHRLVLDTAAPLAAAAALYAGRRRLPRGARLQREPIRGTLVREGSRLSSRAVADDMADHMREDRWTSGSPRR